MGACCSQDVATAKNNINRDFETLRRLKKAMENPDYRHYPVKVRRRSTRQIRKNSTAHFKRRRSSQPNITNEKQRQIEAILAEFSDSEPSYDEVARTSLEGAQRQAQIKHIMNQFDYSDEFSEYEEVNSHGDASGVKNFIKDTAGHVAKEFGAGVVEAMAGKRISFGNLRSFKIFCIG